MRKKFKVTYYWTTGITHTCFTFGFETLLPRATTAQGASSKEYFYLIHLRALKVSKATNAWPLPKP